MNPTIFTQHLHYFLHNVYTMFTKSDLVYTTFTQLKSQEFLVFNCSFDF